MEFRILDEKTCYYIDRKMDKIIMKKLDIVYTQKNLLEYYENNKSVSLYYDNESGFIIDKEEELLFIPLYNKDKILLEYTYSELENYELLKPHNFYLYSGKKKYAMSSTANKSMHEIVFGRKAQKGYDIDHVDSNGLDNRRRKIREITKSANAANKIKKEGTSSKYLGVTILDGKWQSGLNFDRKFYRAGLFTNEEEAAKARDILALYFHKEAAKLNLDSNGNYFLSKEEIEDVIKNPEKYKPEKKIKTRELPTNIFTTGKSYGYLFFHDKIQYRKGSYKTIEEALSGMALKREELENIDKIKEEEFRKNIIRNGEGTAYINTYNKDEENNGEYWLDDDDWQTFSQSYWHNCYGYASGNYKGITQDLHLHIYYSHYGKPPEGMSVNHKNGNKNDCRKSNLEAATYSLQVQNTVRKREMCIEYRGVRIEGLQFYVSIKKNREVYRAGPYQTSEEAALKYNSMVVELFGETGKQNLVTSSGTTVANYYHRDNLTVDIIKNLKTIIEFITVFKVNKEWLENENFTCSDMLKRDIEIYRKKAIEHLEEYLKKGIKTIDNYTIVKNSYTQGIEREKKTSIPFVGVKLQGMKFITTICSKGETYNHGPYETAEEAALKYNELALEYYGAEAKINNVTTEGSTVYTYFHSSKLTVDFIRNIQTISEIIPVFQVNGWNKKGGYTYSDYRANRLQELIDVAIKFKQEELSSNLKENFISINENLVAVAKINNEEQLEKVSSLEEIPISIVDFSLTNLTNENKNLIPKLNIIKEEKVPTPKLNIIKNEKVPTPKLNIIKNEKVPTPKLKILPKEKEEYN